MNRRSSIFDDAADLDLGGFKPDAAPATAPDRETLQRISEASNFPSRQAPRPVSEATAARIAQRRYRTGRNQQINIRATAETKSEFEALCAAQNWVTGETLERALAALKRELARE